MLTTPTSSWDEDFSMIERWGMTGMESFESEGVREKEFGTRQESSTYEDRDRHMTEHESRVEEVRA
jgi:hypothetical protein